MAGMARSEKEHTCSCPLRWLFVKVLGKENYCDSQTWFATDISIEMPKKAPFIGTEILEMTPLL